MRIAVPLIALLLTTAAAPAPSVPQGVQGATPVLSPEAPGRVCRDHIEVVRAERGLPKLQRDTASPEEPLFIAAVDKRIDGCSVMVMRNDTSDVRPLPAADGVGRLMPAR